MIKTGLQKDALIALDYFCTGVNIEANNLGCVYNAACCFYVIGKYTNAKKWFQQALSIDSNHHDSYVGLAIVNLKLGNITQAYQSIRTKDLKTSYSDATLVLIELICCKFTKDWARATELNQKLKPAFKKGFAEKLREKVWCIMLLPLARQREQVEDIIENMVEMW